MTQPTLRQVREELAAIHDELLALPVDDFDRRAQIQSRQHELRALSAELVSQYETEDAETLKEAFDRLQKLRDAVVASHLSPQATAVGFGGVETDFNTIVNEAIDKGADRAEIESQLEDILRRLRSSS